MLREEEEPLQGLRSSGGRGRPQAAGLVTKIGEDRLRFRQRHTVVNEDRNPPCGIDREEWRFSLFSFRQIDRDLFAVQPQLQHRERDFLADWVMKMIQLHCLLSSS